MTASPDRKKREQPDEPSIEEPGKHSERPPISDPPAEPKKPAPIKDLPKKR